MSKYTAKKRIWTGIGALAGLVMHWSSFWIYTMLKIDQIIKCVWCYFRLRSGKWLKRIKGVTQETRKRRGAGSCLPVPGKILKIAIANFKNICYSS